MLRLATHGTRRRSPPGQGRATSHWRPTGAHPGTTGPRTPDGPGRPAGTRGGTPAGTIRPPARTRQPVPAADVRPVRHERRQAAEEFSVPATPGSLLGGQDDGVRQLRRVADGSGRARVRMCPPVPPRGFEPPRTFHERAAARRVQRRPALGRARPGRLSPGQPRSGRGHRRRRPLPPPGLSAESRHLPRAGACAGARIRPLVRLRASPRSPPERPIPGTRRHTGMPGGGDTCGPPAEGIGRGPTRWSSRPGVSP
jgi:hypothetical protein